MLKLKYLIAAMIILTAAVFFLYTPSEGGYSARGVERAVLEKVNEQRAINGLNSLEWNDQVALVARQHSKAMAEQNFFAHDNPYGLSFSERMKQLNAFGAGENILKMHANMGSGVVDGELVVTSENMSSVAVSMWMNSPGHRQNILGGFTKSGVGVYYDSEENSYYFTQVFLG